MTYLTPPARARNSREVAPAGAASRDLFQLDSPLSSGIRDERTLMAFPFFALF